MAFEQFGARARSLPTDAPQSPLTRPAVHLATTFPSVPHPRSNCRRVYGSTKQGHASTVGKEKQPTFTFSAKTRPFTWLRPCQASHMPEAIAVGPTEAPSKATPAPSDKKSSTHSHFPQKQGRRKVAGMTPERARRRHSDGRPKTEGPRPSSKAKANEGRGTHHPT